MQLHPRENFTIVRQIEDHTDSATYYVRAVIRNAKTDAIIQVNGNNYLNLTDKGSQRFSANWLVPADASGQGFWITILTSVYTDSGYTTKSQNYGDKMETYLVQDRMNPNLGGYGGGGADIDYKKIRKIVDKVVSERLKEDIEMPEIPKVIKVEIEKEKVVVPVVNVPPPPSLKPVLDAIKEVKKDISEIEFPESEKVEFQPVLDHVSKSIEMVIEKGGSSAGKVIEELKSAFEKIVERLDKMNVIEMKMPEVKKEEHKFDPRISNLMKKR